MGKEMVATVRIGGRAAECTVLLEGGEIICRGALRRRFPTDAMVGVRVRAGRLEFGSGEDAVEIALGDKAESWLEAIKNPRTRTQKLGIKQGMRVCVLGKAEPDSLEEIASVIGKDPARRLSKGADVILFFVTAADELERLVDIEPALGEGGAVWVLWPKGRKDIGHEEVVEAAKRANLSQTKSIGFSAVFSGLRVVRRASKSR